MHRNYLERFQIGKEEPPPPSGGVLPIALRQLKVGEYKYPYPRGSVRSTNVEVEAMQKELKRLSAFIAVGLFATVANFSAPAIAADYPPSVEVLEVGKPLAEPVKVKTSGVTAVVPVATAGVIPIVIGEPITATSARLSTKTLTNKSVQSTPIKLNASLTLGGVGADEATPVATISRSKKSEIQVPVDVPTRIVVKGFKGSASGTVSFVGANGKSISLGKIKVSKSGRVTIPALTFGKKNVSYTIKITIDGKTTSFTVRGTA